MKFAIQRLANRFGYRITRVYDRSLSPELLDAIREADPHTTTGSDAMTALYEAVQYTVRAGIPGSFVECGVWKGGAARRRTRATGARRH